MVDLKRDDGSEVTVHCPNTGAMTGCLQVDAKAYCSRATNPARKYPLTLEWLEFESGHRACINTMRPNAIVAEGIRNGVAEPLKNYTTMHSECRYGRENSRIDWLLQSTSKSIPDCYLEVKNVTLCEGENGYFPDAVSLRALKHLRELIWMRAQGYRAMVIFCVNHTAIRRLYPADKVQHDYGELLRSAQYQGVELLAYRTDIQLDQISLMEEIPVLLD